MSKKDHTIKSQIVEGKTPNRGWFAKGRSGNPKGRPPKTKPTTDASFRDEFLKSAEAPMTLMENGKEIKIPAHSAVNRAEIIAAIKGSPHAQRNFTDRYERLRKERAEEIENDHLEWLKYINAYDTIVKGFAARHELLPPYYPHPDELQFIKGRYVTGWLGGEPHQAAILRHFYVRVRDTWLLQSEKDRRHFGSDNELDHVSGQIGLLINGLLPNGAQLDVVGLAIRLGRQRGLRKRELQRRLTDAWIDVGNPDGRNLTTDRLNDIDRVRLFQRLNRMETHRTRSGNIGYEQV